MSGEGQATVAERHLKPEFQTVHDVVVVEQWDQTARRLTEDEGALIDVFVAGVGPTGWQVVLDLPREKGWAYEYAEDGKRLPVPTPQIITTRRSTVSCSFKFEVTPNLSLTTAFFDPDDIELWFDPRRLVTRDDVTGLRSVIRMLGRRLKADVMVTTENHHDWVYLRYDLDRDEVIEVDS